MLMCRNRTHPHGGSQGRTASRGARRGKTRRPWRIGERTADREGEAFATRALPLPGCEGLAWTYTGSDTVEAARMSGTDPSLFVRLLLQHQNGLLRYVLPLVGNLDDAEDVVQQTALWQKFDQYDPSRPFLPWAKRFAHHEVLMYHRKQ